MHEKLRQWFLAVWQKTWSKKKKKTLVRTQFYIRPLPFSFVRATPSVHAFNPIETRKSNKENPDERTVVAHERKVERNELRKLHEAREKETRRKFSFFISLAFYTRRLPLFAAILYNSFAITSFIESSARLWSDYGWKVTLNVCPCRRTVLIGAT